MRIRIKRIVAGVLAGMLVLQLIGTINIGKVETVEAATTLATVNEVIVTERLKELIEILGINDDGSSTIVGDYFTESGNTCSHGTYGTCDNCRNSVIISSNNWFGKKFGYTLTISQLSGHYYPNGGTGYPQGCTCHGFVNFVLWYIARESNTSKVSSIERVGDGTEKFTVANLKALDVRPGDVIRTAKGHSFVFLSYVDSDTIRILDCNGTGYVARTAVRNYDELPSYAMAVTRVSNYEPDAVISGSATLPSALTSTSSSTAKANLITYAQSLVGWNRNTFINAGRSDIPSGDWCTWFLKLCADKVGIGSLFSSKTTVATFCTDMIKNYGATAYYYSDSSFLTTADKTVLSGAKAVTKDSFTPIKGDIYVLHESGFDSLSQVGFVMKVVDGSVYAVVGNNGTAAEVQTRTSTTNYFYQLTNANCPIVAIIRPNYSVLNEVALTSISLSASSATLKVGDTKTLSVTYNPSNTTDSKTVTWKSSNTSVATVSSSGKITAKGAGTATITATCGSCTATCKVTVEKAVTAMSMSTQKVSMKVGGKNTMKLYDNTGAAINNKDVVWKSSNTSIATVDSSGVVTAVSDGTVTIYASSADGTVSTSCVVTVAVAATETTTTKKTVTTDTKKEEVTTTKNSETATPVKKNETSTTKNAESDVSSEIVTSESETTTQSRVEVPNIDNISSETVTTLTGDEMVESQLATEDSGETEASVEDIAMDEDANALVASIITAIISAAGVVVFLITKKIRQG